MGSCKHWTKEDLEDLTIIDLVYEFLYQQEICEEMTNEVIRLRDNIKSHYKYIQTLKDTNQTLNNQTYDLRHELLLARIY